MRLVKVNAPEGKGADIAKLAFSIGIGQVAVQKAEIHSSEGETEIKDLIDIQTSTPKAKHFVDALIASDFYNQENYTINTRQPRSLS